jgi:hypothetical protein
MVDLNNALKTFCRSSIGIVSNIFAAWNPLALLLRL